MNALAPPPPVAIRQLVLQGLGRCGRAWTDLVFPWKCLLCGREEDSQQAPFCPTCRAWLLASAAKAAALACPRCALPIAGAGDATWKGCVRCLSQPPGFDAAFALGAYASVLRGLCLKLKADRNAWLAPWLGRLLAEAWHAELARLPGDAWIVPVPLHWWRRMSRGYNQAEGLAGGLAARLGLCVHQPLRRIRATDHLAHLSAEERMAAMSRAFRIRDRAGLAGRTVILVDDILTTGATCGAAARTLKQGGAGQVVVTVVARTP